MTEIRCVKCKRLLMKMYKPSGDMSQDKDSTIETIRDIETKCDKCKTINTIRIAAFTNNKGTHIEQIVR